MKDFTKRMFAQGTVGIAPFSVQYCFPKSKQRRTLRGWVHQYTYVIQSISILMSSSTNFSFEDTSYHLLSSFLFYSTLIFFQFSIFSFKRARWPPRRGLIFLNNPLFHSQWKYPFYFLLTMANVNYFLYSISDFRKTEFTFLCIFELN